MARIGYDGLHADADLETWRTRGLNPVTQELIDVIRREPIDAPAVLDVGAGVGAVHLSLLESGAARAIDVDASPEYLAAARAEAERRGVAGQVVYHHGDIVELAESLPAVDIVTMDSVICCYPYLAPLIQAVLRSRPRLVGLTYPRDAWWMRAYMRLYNLVSAVRRSPSRYFIHRHARLNQLMSQAGYHNAHEGGIRVWRVVLYRRADPGPTGSARA